MRKRALLTGVAAGATVVLTLLVCLVGEAALRMVHLLRDGIPFLKVRPVAALGRSPLIPIGVGGRQIPTRNS